MIVKDIMTKKIITKDKHTPIWEIARIMNEYDIGFVPITDNNKIIGVVTDRDITVKCVKENINNNESIEEYTSKNIISVDNNSDIKEILKVMSKNKIKRVLVTEDTNVVGIVSLSDIIGKYSNSDNILSAMSKIFKIDNNTKRENTSVETFKL